MQNIELDDMMTIVHGLKMSGLASIEPDALDPINERIKNLPSSEEMPDIYTNGREVERLCTEVGRIMELIDYYGTKGSEYTSRYKAKTGLPPRYKNLEWKKAGTKNMKIKKKAEMDAFTDASTQMEAMISELYDIPNQLDTIINETESFSQNFNNNLKQVASMIPKNVQSSLMQYVGILNESTTQVVSTANLLKGHVNTIQQSAQGVSGLSEETQESYQTYMANVASTDYIKGIVKLSGNMEGNGIVSEKLLAYAKSLKDNDPMSYYAALEVRSALRTANFGKEADTLMKTAGLWDSVKDTFKGVGKGLAATPQGAKDGYNAGKAGGRAGIIDPGTQDQESWQTGDIETQFKNDVDWLKRSWVNLIDFFKRYVRDAEILVKEWGNKDEKKVAKIVELRDQALALLKKAEDILASGNFSSQMMGVDLFGPDKDKDPTTPPGGDQSTGPVPNPGGESSGEWNFSNQQQLITPFMMGDWKNTNLDGILTLLDKIDQTRIKAQEDQMYADRESSNKDLIKVAQSSEQWKKIGVDPASPTLQLFVAGTFDQLTQKQTDEIREIVSKVKEYLGIDTEEPPEDPPVDPPVDDPNTPQIEGRSNEQALQESGDQALAPYLEKAAPGIQKMIDGESDQLNNDDWNKLKILMGKLQQWQRTNEDTIQSTYGIAVANSKSQIKTAMSEEMVNKAREQFDLLMKQQWHAIHSVELGQSIAELHKAWISGANTAPHGDTQRTQLGEGGEEAPQGDQAQIGQNPQLGDQGIEYYAEKANSTNRNCRSVFKKILDSNEKSLVSVTPQEWGALDELINAIGMYQQKSNKTASTRNSFNLMRMAKIEGKQEFMTGIKALLSKGDYLNINVQDFKDFKARAMARQKELDPSGKGAQQQATAPAQGAPAQGTPAQGAPAQDPNAQKKTQQQ
jgi:hypothetical protein